MAHFEELSPMDLHRQYIEKALRDIRPYCSPQTGLLHLHPDIYSGVAAQAAPTYENFLFVLLLLRKKTVESAQAAKVLLDRLLHFQNLDPGSDQYGNFPALLTDYPSCRDWHLPISLCLVVTAIRTGFDAILGEDCKHRLHACHQALFACVQQNQKKCHMSSWAAFVVALQRVLLNPPSESSSVLKALAESTQQFVADREWLNPEAFGKVLAAVSHLQCGALSIPASLLGCARHMWSPDASTYAGPALGVFQFGDVPATTLFDCVMSLYFTIPLKERPWPYRTSLELALVNPPETAYASSQEPLQWGNDKPFAMWPMGNLTVAACFFEPRTSETYGFQPIRIVTPSGTMVIHFPNGQLLGLTRKDTTFVGTMKIMDIKFNDPCLIRAYIERHEGTKPHVNGVAASVFDPQQGISVANGRHTIHLSSQIPSSTCLGHVSCGNRPGQLLARKKSESVAYDWTLSIDYVRGEIPHLCHFSFEIECPQ